MDHKLIERISSLQNLRVKKAIRLHSSRGRQSQGRIIVFGQREFERALDSQIEFEEVFVCESMSELDRADLQGRLNRSTSQMFVLNQDVFTKVTYGDRSDEVVGIAVRPRTSLKSLPNPKPALVVVVQSLEKPGNLGAIIRSADACAVSAVVLADPMTDFFHPNSIRSSTGTVFSMPVATGTTEQVQGWLKQNGFGVFTATSGGARDLFETDLTGNVALVLGNEATGLDAQWQQEEFTSVKLPMSGQADSLNVSVTAAVMIYEATRQRQMRP